MDGTENVCLVTFSSRSILLFAESFRILSSKDGVVGLCDHGFLIKFSDLKWLSVETQNPKPVDCRVDRRVLGRRRPLQWLLLDLMHDFKQDQTEDLTHCYFYLTTPMSTSRLAFASQVRFLFDMM